MLTLCFPPQVIGDHPAPWLRLRAQRATAPCGLQSFDKKKMQDTLGDTPSCRSTLACALNSCRVVFATAGRVANWHRLFLGAAPGKPQIGFAFSFVDEACRHSITVGFHLAAMGSQCLLCSDPGPLRPYSRVQLLAACCSGNLQACDIAWPTAQAFKYNNVDMPSAGPHVHCHDSHQFCTTSTLQFFLYCTWSRASILAPLYRMNMPVATIMRALFPRGGLGYYHSPIHPLSHPVLHPLIRIVDLDTDGWWEQV